MKVNDQLYRLLVESVRDYAIFTLDPTGHIMSWNPGAERIKGYTAEEIIGQHFSVFYPPETKDTLPPRELLIAQAEGRIEDEGWRVRNDGTLFWANVVITALYDDDELVGFAKVTRDLTERKRAEDQAREDAQRIAEAEAENRTKSEFLTALSHELRTPLNAIAGYVDLLAAGVRGPVSEHQRRDLERIRHSQQHLLGLINDLLFYSRIESGAVRYDIRDVAVRDVATDVISLIEAQAHAQGIEVRVHPPRAPLLVQADAGKLEQILLNLLSNAVKHSPPDGTIVVEWLVDQGRCAIHVGDEGPGVPLDKLEAIFEPFVQVGRSLTSSHEGTGLGLSISRDLARAMDGDLTVRSRPGEGAVFTVWLPLAAAQPQAQRGSSRL